VIATTWVTVLRGTSTDLFGDQIDLSSEAGGDTRTRIPASLIEGSRTIKTPNSPTPRIVRYATARLAPGTDITVDDRLRDENTGRIYAVTAVTQPAAIGFTPPLRLDLTLIN
jgi:hypothetical protein